MRNAILILLFSNLGWAICEKPEAEKTKWIQCKSNDDCVVSAGECGWPMAINKGYSADVETFNRCKAPVIDCKSYDGLRESALTSVCFSGKCTLKTSETNAKGKRCEIEGLLYGEMGPTGMYKHCYRGSIVTGVIDFVPAK